NFSFAIYLAPSSVARAPSPASLSNLVILIKLVVLRAQLRRNVFKSRQIKLSHLGLIGKRERLVPARRVFLLKDAALEHRLPVANAAARSLQPFEQVPDPLRLKAARDRIFQLGKLGFLLDRNSSLLECHPQIPGAGDGNRTRDQQLGRL